jgi:pyrimidine deaminase RibD-like protein
VSSDDGLRHAEDILFEAATKGGLALGKDVVLYATLEPCSKRSIKGTPDCVTQIIGAGIGSVVFGARDPKQSDETNRRLTETGVSIRQINDLAIVKRCADIFNESVTPEHREVDVTLKPGD